MNIWETNDKPMGFMDRMRCSTVIGLGMRIWICGNFSTENDVLDHQIEGALLW